MARRRTTSVRLRRAAVAVAAASLLAAALVAVDGGAQRAWAAAPVPCSITSPWLVNQRSSGSDVQNKDNVLEYFDLNASPPGLISPPIVDLNDVTAPNRPGGIDEELNGLGISADGTKAYFTSHYLTGSPNAPAGGSQIYEYDLVTGAVRAWPTPAVGASDDNLRVRRGAVDPRSGVFYYSTSNGNGTVQYLYAVDPDAGTPWYVGAVTTPNQVGVSGDFAFDGSGQLFFVTGSSSVAYVNVLDGVLPTSPATGPVQLTVRYLSTVSGTGNGVGISYGLNGYLYVTNTAGEWYEVDPSTGAVVADLGNVGGNGATVDVATCAYPSTLEVLKDVDSKPYPTDQFTVSVERVDDGAQVGAPATTTGNAGSRRAELGPVPILTGTASAPVDYAVSERLAAGSPSASLADYGTHLRCVDNADPSNPVLLLDSDPTAAGTRSGVVSATGPSGATGYQAIVCTLTNRDVRPARLVFHKQTDESPDETPEVFAMHYPDVDGTPDADDGTWPGSPRGGFDTFSTSDPIDGDDGQGLTFQPYRCASEDPKHVFHGCVPVDGTSASGLDFDLSGLGDDPAGVLQFQEQLTQAQIAAGWRRAGVPQCTATNTNPSQGGANLDTISPVDDIWAPATGGLAQFQVAVGSVEPGTVIACDVRNTRALPTWTVEKFSNPTTGTAATPAQVLPGGTITYTLRVENPSDTSEASISDALISDDLSRVLVPGVAFDDDIRVTRNGVAVDSPDVTLADDALTWHIDSVAQGDSWVLTYSVTVADSAAGYGLDLVNTAAGSEASGTDPPDGCSEADPCSTYHATPAPNWTVTKATSTGELQADGSYLTTPGFPVVYTLTVDNTSGEAPLYGVTIDDGPVGGAIQDIWDVATWDGTFTVQLVTPQRFVAPVPYTTHTDANPGDGLQYTFPDPIPPGTSAVISFTLVLDPDVYEITAQNVVQAQMPDAPSFGPADCDEQDGPTQAAPCATVLSTAPGTLTLRKTTDPAGWEAMFGLSADSGLVTPPLAGVPVAFSGVAGSADVDHRPVYSGVRYTISEAPNAGRDPDDWTNTPWSCWVETDPESEVFTVDLRRLGTDATTTVLVQSGQDTVCSIANTLAAGTTLALAKQVTNGHGGTASPTAWTLVARAGGDAPVIDGPGVAVSPTRAQTAAVDVSPGTAYTLSESGGPAGYQQAAPAWVCLDTGAPGAPVDLVGAVVTPEPGQSLVCTVANEDLPGIVTVTKYGPAADDPAVPLAGAAFVLWFDQDGSGTFDPAADVPVAGGTTGGDGTLRWTGLGWGTYFVQETGPPPGYALAADPVQTLAVASAATTGAGVTVVFHDPVATSAWSLAKSSDPTSGSVVAPGATIAYTLTATNTSDVPVAGATASDDLSGVLGHARLAGPLPAGLALAGGTLTWTLPSPLEPGATATVRYTVVVADDAWGVELDNAVTPGDPAGSCDVCTTAHRTLAGPMPTPSPPGPAPAPPGPLPMTGLDVAGFLALALLLAGAGALAVATARRRATR